MGSCHFLVSHILFTQGIYAYCAVPRRTQTELRRRLFPDEDPDTCLEPGKVAEIVVSIALDASPLLTGQVWD